MSIPLALCFIFPLPVMDSARIIGTLLLLSDGDSFLVSLFRDISCVLLSFPPFTFPTSSILNSAHHHSHRDVCPPSLFHVTPQSLPLLIRTTMDCACARSLGYTYISSTTNHHQSNSTPFFIYSALFSSLVLHVYSDLQRRFHIIAAADIGHGEMEGVCSYNFLPVCVQSHSSPGS